MSNTKILVGILIGSVLISSSIYLSALKMSSKEVINQIASEQFDRHVIEKVFDECFDYYSKNGETGIDKSLIELCQQKITQTSKQP